ncbi:delta 1-pyrroline-5-carboxylate synthetase, putative [Ricinus communis]|uniref:Delta 1-pyrroline-5-carboxylate synthetase, putative n=1 Tax=Ricinus communis TaxID=3988 RepID=B9R6W9_RICCO|nr:delta 1-pyrroline-5-carboxylate synthetase, putative [Ricinus communis]
MEAKVKAAIKEANSGIPVMITSGFAAESISKVLRGERVSTLFDRDAHLWAEAKEVDGRELAVAARESCRRLQMCCMILRATLGIKIRLLLYDRE